MTIHWVWCYDKLGSKGINIIETDNWTVCPHIRSVPSTAHTIFLSATHAIVIDPILTFNKVALLRNTQLLPGSKGTLSGTGYCTLAGRFVETTRLLTGLPMLPARDCGVHFGGWGVKAFGIAPGLL